MFCGIDNILHNILHIQQYLQNIVSPTKQCYGVE